MLLLFAIHVASERDSFGLCTELKPMKIACEVGVEITRENENLLAKRTETKRSWRLAGQFKGLNLEKTAGIDDRALGYAKPFRIISIVR